MRERGRRAEEEGFDCSFKVIGKMARLAFLTVLTEAV